MSPAGFEPTIPASEQPPTFKSLDNRIPMCQMKLKQAVDNKVDTALTWQNCKQNNNISKIPT
jgi:hypothetical protein